MKKGFLIIMVTISAWVFSTCSKKDLQNYKNKCDYVEALSYFSFDYGGEILLRPLFKKEYQPGSNQLQKVSYHFLNQLGALYNLKSADVEYKGNTVLFRRPGSTDTVALLNFNQAGRLVDAMGDPGMGKNTCIFRFNYTLSGKLREVLVKVLSPYYVGTPVPGPEWKPYVTLTYDAKEENVTNTTISSIFGEKFTIAFSYDYSRKIKNQLYPDQDYVGYCSFWLFLQYLNVFPEIQPKNMLLASTTFVIYPGTQKRFYHDQVIDVDGNLTSYMVNVGSTPTSSGSYWQINWQCGKNYVPKAMD